MKLLCSILILAGVFALNDAAISHEDQMRIIKDQLMLEDLKRMATNRDANSVECSKTLLDSLTEVLKDYNNQVRGCEQTQNATLEGLNEDARRKIVGYGARLQDTCDALITCSSLGIPINELSCLEAQSALSANNLTSVSVDASVTKIELQKNTENVNGEAEVCLSDAMGKYRRASDKSNAEFTECVNGKPSNGGPTEPTTITTPTTIAPTPTSDGGEEVESRRRRPNGGNKYSRF